MSEDATLNFGGVSRPAPNWTNKRPIRIAVLGDFGAGALSGRMHTGTDLSRQKPRAVEFDTLEDALQRAGLKLQLPLGPDGAPIEIEITELESFHPDELYRNVELFSALGSLRKRLNTPSTFNAAAAELKTWAKDAGRPISKLAGRTRSRGATPGAANSLDDFARLTGRKRPAGIEQAGLQDYLRRVVGPFVVPAANPNRDANVAHVDEALGDAMRAVLHHPDFQNLESLWRGVDFLLRRIETGPQLQVHLIDLSAEEFAADLAAVDDLSQSGLYQLLVQKPGEEADGGYSYIVGCYQFDATPAHVELLGRAARLCAHAGAPLVTGIATDAFVNRREPPAKEVRNAFAALREMPDASYLGLIGPRFMLRNVYGKRSEPITSFAFEEFTPSVGLRGMLWGHPALLAISVLAVRGGQLNIGDLPFHHFRDEDGDSVALPCTDRLIGTDAASLLRSFGINGVMAYKGEARVRLAGLEAINGDGLAAATGLTRKAPSDSRAEIGSSESQRTKTTWEPAARSAGTVVVSSEAQALAESDEAPPASGESTEAPTAEQADGGAIDELDQLLADLETPASAETPAEPAAEPEPEMDPELEKLLADVR